jgi:hypothetical protein
VLGRRAGVGDHAAGIAAVLRGAADRLGSLAAAR